MARFISFTLLALPLVACGLDTEGPAPPIDPVAKAADAPDDVSAPGSGGDDRGSAQAAPVCDAEGPYVAAPDGAPVCPYDAVCDADQDCDSLPGTYCKPDLCAFQGCLRGGCVLTKVQGQACARDGECVSGTCACEGEACKCAPEEGPYDFHFP